MSNIRVTIARLVMRYNVSFAPSSKDPVAEWEKGMYEHFAMQAGPVTLCLERRK